MGFATVLALALAGLAVLPWVAHRLRRSPPKERLFAPLRFVPEHTSPSDVPSGVDDRALFAVRVVIVALLALLAAGLRTQGQGLVLREGNGDANVVFVLDDSASMQARSGSSTRLAFAKNELGRLLDDLEGGDRVALVLAGKPARVVRGFSHDLRAVHGAIDAVVASDRPTDLAAAVAAAEALAGDASEGRTTLVVATDGRGGRTGATIETRLPLHVIAAPTERDDNCAVLEARGLVDAVDVTLACEKAAKRRLRWVAGGREVAALDVDLAEGTGVAHLAAAGSGRQGLVELVGGDAIESDDRVEVLDHAPRMRMAVVDSVTGADDEDRTPPALLRALEAVAPDAEVLRVAQIPSDAPLADLDVLAIDNATAWAADTRLALQGAVDDGLSLVVTFGPASTQGALGASFEPFVDGPVQWESGAFAVTLPGSETSASLNGRARFTPAAPSNDATLRFDDHAEFLARVQRGDGRVALLAAPADPHHGDLALRAGFVEFLASVVEEARRVRPRGALKTGDRWPLPSDATVVGPAGAVPLEGHGADTFADLARAGVYRVALRGKERERRVSLDADEVLGKPVELRSVAAPVAAQSVLRDRSTWVALVLAAVLVLEVGLRLRLRGLRNSNP